MKEEDEMFLKDGTLLTDEKVEQIVDEVHQAIKDGKFKIVPNPHYKKLNTTKMSIFDLPPEIKDMLLESYIDSQKELLQTQGKRSKNYETV
jgi:hypothetical protein